LIKAEIDRLEEGKRLASNAMIPVFRK